MEEHKEQRSNTLKKLKSDYGKFCSQATSVIDSIESSNEQLGRLIHEFNRDSEAQKSKRQESFAAMSHETDSDLDALKKKLLNYAAKNNSGIDSIRSSLKALMNFQ